MSNYTYAKLSDKDFLFFRVGGPGLGNLLFPWARSIIASEKYGYLPVWPTWPQLKMGTFLRGEKDKRSYTNLFNQNYGYVHGLDKLKLLTSTYTEKEHEEQLEAVNASLKDKSMTPKVFVFTGMTDMFKPLISHNGLIRKKLEQMANQSLLNFDTSELGKTISVHIRMGDFAEYNENKKGNAVNNMRMPTSWYINVIKQINDSTNKNCSFNVFSDGSNDELGDILKIKNVRRQSYGTALSDMLAMSYTKALISSNSTFSLWAAYLGQLPVLKYKHFSAGGLADNNNFFNLDSSISLPEEFVNIIK